jgi:hypothetical protein
MTLAAACWLLVRWRVGRPRTDRGNRVEGRIMAGNANLRRETLRSAPRVIQTAETLGQARIPSARMLNVFDKLEARGITGNAAVREPEERLAISGPPQPERTAADERPVRRRQPGKAGRG